MSNRLSEDLILLSGGLILDHLKEAAAECSHGQVKFSVIYPGTHVHPHSGPTNCRLRAHLGLSVPPGDDGGRLEMRIADGQMLTWKEGQVFVIDDSFEHEVWHEKANGGVRLVLIIDLWHPDLSAQERATLAPLDNRNKNHSTVFTIGGLTEKLEPLANVMQIKDEL